MAVKCLDTYALVEICNGHPAFVPYLTQTIVITDLTLAEFYGDLYKKYGVQTADYWHKKLSALCRPVSREILVKAVKYRLDHRKQNLSFFDCAGYLFALENNFIFVTGDKEFKEKESV